MNIVWLLNALVLTSLFIGFLAYKLLIVINRNVEKTAEKIAPKTKVGVYMFEAITYFLIAIGLAIGSNYTSSLVGENDAFIVITFAIILATLQTLYKFFDVIFKAMHEDVEKNKNPNS